MYFNKYLNKGPAIRIIPEISTAVHIRLSTHCVDRHVCSYFSPHSDKWQKSERVPTQLALVAEKESLFGTLHDSSVERITTNIAN